MNMMILSGSGTRLGYGIKIANKLAYNYLEYIMINKNDKIALFEAINSIELVKKLIHSKVDVNVENEDGMTVLMWVSLQNNKDIAKLLIENGANVNAESEDGETALMFTSLQNSKDVAKLLIENGADVNAKSEDGMTELMVALFNNSKDIAKLLIENGADVNAESEDGMTALMVALFGNSKDIAKLLIENGADVNAKSEDDETALIFALQKNSKDVAKLLIENGADVNVKSEDGVTALMFASFYNSKDIAKLLIKNGADVNAKDEDDETALFKAVDANSIDCINLLVESGIKVTNCLLNVVINNLTVKKEDIYKKIKDPNIRELNLKNMKNCMSKKDIIDMLELLIEYGASIDTSLILLDCIVLDEVEIVELLIKKEANIDIKNKQGYSAIDLAYDKKEIKLVLQKVWAKKRKLSKKDKNKIDKLRRDRIKLLEKNGEKKFKSSYSSTFQSTKVGMTSSLKRGRIFFTAYELVNNDIELPLIKKHLKKDTIDYPYKNGKTALMLACEKGDEKLVEILLCSGANVSLEDKDENNAYDYADKSDKSDAIKELLNQAEKLAKPKHNPKRLVNILTNFTKDTPIKYTTHPWDFGSIDSKHGGFDGFIKKVQEQFDDISQELEILSPNLYKKIDSFLVQNDIKESWSQKAEVKIGWQTIETLKKWCDEGKSPFDFELQTPITVEDKKLRLFKDVIELFKKEIQIRNENNHLENIFLKQQKKLGKDFKVELIKLQGKEFYTDVEKFENSIERIFDAIKIRKEHNKVTIKIEEPDNETIEIIITQHGSCSYKSSEDMLRAVEGGDLNILKENLTNLCEWSIEDSYEDEGFRVNCFSDEIELLDKTPDGFTHILRFYKK